MKGAQEVLDQLAKLRARQVSRGCTAAEQEAAARRIGELLMQYEELEVALPDRKGARLHPLSPEQRSQRQQDEDLKDDDPVDLGFVFTLQVTEKAVLIALPYRTQHRFHPPRQNSGCHFPTSFPPAAQRYAVTGGLRGHSS